MPDVPTTWPLSLIATAAATESPENTGSSWIWPGFGPQMTASKSRTWGEMQLGSCVAVSAIPTTWPPSLMPKAALLLPPSEGSAVITPFCQRKPSSRFCQPWQLTLVQKKAAPQNSPNGSKVEVWAVPMTNPLSFLTGNATELLRPPSVPTSVMTPSRQRKACSVWSPARFASPVTQPLLLTPPNPLLAEPPSVPKSMTE